MQRKALRDTADAERCGERTICDRGTAMNTVMLRSAVAVFVVLCGGVASQTAIAAMKDLGLRPMELRLGKD
jgi:hypothetical protein